MVDIERAASLSSAGLPSKTLLTPVPPATGLLRAQSSSPGEKTKQSSGFPPVGTILLEIRRLASIALGERRPAGRLARRVLVSPNVLRPDHRAVREFDPPRADQRVFAAGSAAGWLSSH